MPRPAHLLMACVVALLGLGVVMVRSAGMNVASAEIDAAAFDGTVRPEALLGVLRNQNLAYALLAVAAMALGYRIDLSRVFRGRGWRSPVLWVTLGAVVLCGITLVPGVGHNVNGASRWLRVGPPGSSAGVTFQPSEVMKWSLVVALAWWCARRRGAMHRMAWGLMPPLLLVGLACGLIVIEDLGTAGLLAAVSVVVLVAGGARLWQLACFVPFAAAAVVAAVAQSPYRVRRLTAFLDPWADHQGTGYHPIQSMLAFAQGGVSGRGLGQSVQKYYIPEDTTDFVFPVLAEELGLGGAAMVVGLYLAILWLGLGVARRCPHLFGRLVAVGVLLTLGLQAAINLAVVTVVVPTKGIALPLISAGGTGWVLTAFAIGLVASLDREEEVEPRMNADEQGWEPDVVRGCTTESPRHPC
ncbi:MAG: putative peptidoglycan glycosyltransferase FtsW [Planctomycetota bacterium]